MKEKALLSLIFTVVVSIVFLQSVHAVELAITFDDLPAGGPNSVKINRTTDSNKILAALKKHKVAKSYGFINGVLAKNMAEHTAILANWSNSNHLLGNHTFSHKDLSIVSADEYIRDIEQNETILIDYASSIEELKVFRYPFLHEGESHAKRYAIRSYLAKRNYTIAQVTIDFEDWSFNEAYVRCLDENKLEEQEKIKKMYLESALLRYDRAVEKSGRIYGKQAKVPQILLLHVNPLTAELLDELLTLFSKRKAVFVDADIVIKNPIFKEDTSVEMSVGMSYWSQIKVSRKLKWPDLKESHMPRLQLANMCL